MHTHARKTPRAQRYNYTSAGGYFITICTKDREHYFGEIKNGHMIFNQLGQYCYDEIARLEERETVYIHEWVVMPNHVHILLVMKERLPIIGADHMQIVGVDHQSALNNEVYEGPSISSIVKLFKGKVSKFAIKNDIIFAWQRSFHDHIIRNEGEYNRIKYYIQQNPAKRSEDKFHSQL